MSAQFDIEKFSPENVATKIAELRQHLNDELLPGAKVCSDTDFVLPFVEYLASQADLFGGVLTGRMDLLALTCRNLLEFWGLLNEVFSSQESRANFIGEMYLDAEEVRTRVERMGIPKEMLNTDLPEWDTIPDKRVAGKRDEFDDYFFKLCSKCIHPTALSILAPGAQPGPFIFHFFGLNYLTRSYNFLSGKVFSIEEPG
jgi:hypothetical protein